MLVPVGDMASLTALISLIGFYSYEWDETNKDGHYGVVSETGCRRGERERRTGSNYEEVHGG